MRKGIFPLLLTFGSATIAQPFSLKEALTLCAANHPYLKAAGSEVALSQAKLDALKGVLDPYVEYEWSQKSFDSKFYYQHNQAKLAIPTATGVEVFAGYSDNGGDFLNPELGTPAAGQYQLGVAAPVGAALWRNPTSTAIDQGENRLQWWQLELGIRRNELLFQASAAYLRWALAYEVLEVQNEAVALAAEQLQQVKRFHEAGDRPAIDTVEAALQHRLRIYQRTAAHNELTLASIALAPYLWSTDGVMLKPNTFAEPQTLDGLLQSFSAVADSVLLWPSQPVSGNALIRQKELNITNAELQKKLAGAQLCPTVELKYVQLWPGNFVDNGLGTDLANRATALKVKQPLLLRKARANWRLTEAQISMAEYEKALEVARIEAAQQAAAAEYATAQTQIDTYGTLVNQYQQLLEGERNRFDSGEGSVFVLNARENRLFDARVEFLKLRWASAQATAKALRVAQRSSWLLN